MQEKIYGPASYGLETSTIHYEEKYIEDLGLTQEDLGKRILDIAGGDSNFASHVGDNVVTVDIDAHNYQQASSMVATAKAEALPFKDEAFQLVLSTQGLPFFYGMRLRNKEDLKKRIAEKRNDAYSKKWMENALKDDEKSVIQKTELFFSEVLRVLEKGGVGKFAPVPDVPNSWEGRYFKILKNILERLKEEGKLDFKFVDLADSPIGGIKILRLEIIKK